MLIVLIIFVFRIHKLELRLNLKNMNYTQIIDEYQKTFKSEYGEFISNLLKEVEKEKFPIDYLVYTSKTAEKPKQIIKDFLKSESIQDHTITNPIKSFELDLSSYLEMISFQDRKEMDAKLSNKITEQNRKLNN